MPDHPKHKYVKLSSPMFNIIIIKEAGSEGYVAIYSYLTLAVRSEMTSIMHGPLIY